MAEEVKTGAEATISDEEAELATELQGTEDVEELKEKLAKAEELKGTFFIRAKKAEGFVKVDGKWVKPAKTETKPEATQTTTKPALTAEDVDTKILMAQKVSEDDIAYLKKIAALNGTSIIAAQSDDIYLAYKAKKEADEKAQKAHLGASRGSGVQKKEKTISSPGLTDAEHKALWKEQQGQ